MKFFALAFWLTVALAAPAEAGPLAPAIAAVGSWVSGTLAAGGLGSILLRLAGGLILSRLQSLFVKKPKTSASGIKTSVTQTGGVNPQSFILGVYATAGTHVAPPMSQDSNGDPNQWLHYVIDLGDKPQGALRKTWIDGVEATFDGALYEGYGNLATDAHLIVDGGARTFQKYYDGTQTAADAELVSDFASYPERPWLSDMVLTGVPYVVITFSYHREVFQGFPQVKFETEGVALYDPREDTDLGGTGSHTWADESTWEQTLNPQQMIYNIIRGITLPDGSVWGIGADAADLPASNWFAALNDCDEAVDLQGGGTEARYRAGYEVTVDQEPLAVIEELLKACGGEIVEFGGYWHTQVGAPASPSLFISDDDLIITANRDLEPFPGLNETTNAVTASYPDINGSWEVSDAEPLYDEDWEAEDQGRRLTASMNLPAVPYDTQVRRLMRELSLDARRMVSHVITLPPDALHILPLQTISWTSVRNGYTGKTFEVTRKIIDPVTLNSTLALRERDATDYADNSADDAIVPTPPSGGAVIPQIIGTPGWAVAAVVAVDASDNDRRVGIKQTWNTDTQIAGVSFQVRLSGTTGLTHSGTTSDVRTGEYYIWDGILPATDYEVRSRAVSNREALWSDWVEVTTADVGLAVADLSGAVFDAVAADAGAQLADAIDKEAIHDLGDLLYQYQSRNVTRTDIAFVDTSIRAEITEDRIATATARAELAAQIDANAALIVSEQTARADADSAIALDVTQLQTDLTTTDGVVSGHTSAISTLQTTQTAQGGTIIAQASSITALQTTVGGHTTTLTEYGTSIDGIEAQYGVTINANDRVTGFSLIGGGASTSFTVQADKFAIVSPDDTVSAVPFVAYTTETVVGGVTIPAGTVVMDNVLIRDLSAISATIGTFKTSATGERTEIDDDGIRIYYPSGQLAGVFGEIP